jgi:hypothetical protein
MFPCAACAVAKLPASNSPVTKNFLSISPVPRSDLNNAVTQSQTIMGFFIFVLQGLMELYQFLTVSLLSGSVLSRPESADKF